MTRFRRRKIRHTQDIEDIMHLAGRRPKKAITNQIDGILFLLIFGI